MMKFVLSALCFLSVCSAAHATTIAEKKAIAQAKKDLAEDNEDYGNVNFKKYCGYSLPASVDDAMVLAYLPGNYSAASYCDGARSALSHLCEDATAKPEVVKKVKALHCTTAKSGVTFKLNGTTLEMEVAPETANITEKATKWLEANL